MKSLTWQCPLVIAGCFAIYVFGASPTIHVGDSGELVAAAHTLGIPHPSGYPLYILLSKAFTLLAPIGSIAYRLSLFSALCTALSAGVLFYLLRRLRVGLTPSLFGVGLAALAPSVWSQANIQRVYALNGLFVVLTVATAIRWLEAREARERASSLWLILTFFLCGLGASNHLFMVFQAGALGVVGLVAIRKLPELVETLARAALGFVLGLLPYLYLPWSSRREPFLDWGNPETVEGFLNVVLRRDYWGRRWVEGPADVVTVGFDYLGGLALETYGIGLLAAIFAIWSLHRSSWAVRLAVAIMAANVASMAWHGSRLDLFVWHRYYIPSYWMAGLLAGLGLQELARRSRSTWLTRWSLAAPALALAIGWNSFDRSQFRIADDYGRALLSSLPPGAHLAARDDNLLFVLLYLHVVEGVRPDVDLIPLGVDTDLGNLYFHPDRDPLFLLHHPNWKIEGLDFVSNGWALQSVRAGELPEVRIGLDRLEGELDPTVPKDLYTQNLIGHFHYMQALAQENRDWRVAWTELQDAMRSAPNDDVLHYNIGLVLRRNGLYEEAIASFRRADRVSPRGIGIGGGGGGSAQAQIRDTERERTRITRLLKNCDPDNAEARLEDMGETLAARGLRLRGLMSSVDSRP